MLSIKLEHFYIILAGILHKNAYKTLHHLYNAFSKVFTNEKMQRWLKYLHNKAD